MEGNAVQLARQKRFKRLRRERPYYLIPIMMGMAGVLFSTQLEDPILQTITVMLCLGVPMMIGGNLLARVYSDGLQRFLLIAGIATLTLGAIVTASGLTESLVSSEYVSREVGEMSRWIGISSLLLGLLVVLYSMVRSEALFDELGERFSQVAEHIGEGFLLLNANDEIVLANRALGEQIGLPERELIGRRIGDVARQFKAETAIARDQISEQAIASSYQATYVRNGEERRLLVSESPLFDRRKRLVGRLFTLHDITEEHRLKVRLQEYTEGLQHLVELRTENLRASEARYRGLLVTMNEGFVTVEPDLKIRFSNERMNEILRADEGALTNRSLGDFIHPEDRPRLERALRDAAGGAVVPGQEYLLVREDGQSVPVIASVAALEEGSEFGRARYSLVITDVYELKRMQIELEQRARELELANEELRELDRAKDVFLSNVSHELRTPLGTLDGYIDMLKSESLGAVSGPQRAALDVMSRNAFRLTQMINEMIESSRMQIRGVVLVRELCSVRRLVEEAGASIHPSALNRNLSVNIHAPDSLPYQWGDREKLAQVLGILLSNAVKFTPEGGSITILAAAEGDDVIIAVADTGIGIAREHHERVFKKFYQVDSSMTRHYQGTGIGLSIAKAIVEAHGGRIALESEPGRGSTFRVVLPGAAFRPDQVSPALQGRHVLVVNEFVESLDALSEALGAAGAVVTPLISSFECIRRARERRPDVIVIDEAVRDLVVVETVRRLREDRSTATVPIVTLWDRRSGQPSAEETAIAGQARVLAKPFPPEALVQTIAEAAGGSVAASQAQLAGKVG